MLVGRARELAAGARALDDVVGGRGRLLVLEGEPGIGKTSLADAITADAAARGLAVVWGRCWEGGGAPALHPWTQVFDALGVALPAGDDAGDARLQRFQAATDALAAASRERPIAIVLDDLHISDVSSLLLLQFMTRQLRRVRALVIATRRDVDAALDDERRALLARVAREGETLALRRLDRDEVAGIVRDRAGGLAPELAVRIYAATQGNPFFLDELLRLLDAQAAATAGDLPIPYGVREAIRQRLTSLSEPARATLEAAAVCGVDVDPAQVALTAGADVVETTERLAEAVAAGALAEGGGRRLRFAHALIQDVVHRDLPASRRAELHLSAAAALERLQPEVIPAVEVAHHALAAAPRDATRTIARVERAVQALAAALAVEDAVALAERARAALEPMLDAPAELAALLAIVGDARAAAGDVEGARAAYVRAADHGRVTTGGGALARAALGYGHEFVVGYTDPELVGLLREALARLAPDDVAWRARVQGRLAAALQPATDPQGPVQMALAAIELARATGDDATLLDVTHVAMSALMGYLDPAARRSLNDAALVIAERRRDRVKQLRAHLRLVFDCAELGDLTAVELHIDAFAQLVHQARATRVAWHVPLLRSMMAIHERRWADSDALIEEATEQIAALDDSGARACLAMHRWGRLTVEGRLAEAAAAMGSMLAQYPPSADRTMISASIAAQAGDVPRVRALLGSLDAGTLEAIIRSETIAASAMVDVALLIGDRALAAISLDALRPHAHRWVCWGLSGIFLAGPVRDFIARAAAMLGEAEATAALEAPARAAPEAWSLTRAGEIWTITHDGRTFHLEDRLGLHYLARLVAAPDQELAALDLSGGDDTDGGDAGALLDPEARRAYKERLDEIADELAEAERFGDAVRASRARAEREFLAAELSRAVGLGGRERRAGSAAERARIAVTRRLRDAVKRIAAEDPALGRWLDRAVRTGRFCRYSPI